MKIYLGQSRFSRKTCRIIFTGLRKLTSLVIILFGKRKTDNTYQGSQFYGYIDFFDDEANEKILDMLATKEPCMISKFGTTELSHLVSHILSKRNAFTIGQIRDYLLGGIPSLNWEMNIDSLCKLSGFFPNDSSYMELFYKEYVSAVRQIDILGSYQKNERFFSAELGDCVRVNLDGYYAPFFYSNPWTKLLYGKKVLVVHPFDEEIRSQYKRRSKIWTNPDILPEFELITYKSVQSILNIKTGFDTWFDALDKMKKDISVIDFDIALIGCGAYGMPLAAFCKELGKQAIHLAGWTQVLFGIIGTRWENNPRVSRMINEYWVHPKESSRPKNAVLVENACYW